MNKIYNIEDSLTKIEKDASLKGAEELANAETMAISKHLVKWIRNKDKTAGYDKILCTIPIFDGTTLRSQPVTQVATSAGNKATNFSIEVCPVGANIRDDVLQRLTVIMLDKYSAIQSIDSVTNMNEAIKSAKKLYKQLVCHNFGRLMMGAPAQAITYRTALRGWYSTAKEVKDAVAKVKDGYEISWTNRGEVLVTGGKYNRDPKLDDYYNRTIELLLPEKEDREAFLNYIALTTFSKRTGLVRPILYLHGVVKSGKSLGLDMIRNVVGYENAKAMKADSKFFGAPDKDVVYYDETPEEESNSRKDFWQHLKKISKTTAPTAWEEKNVKSFELLTGAYAVVASNHMAIAAGSGDEIDAVVGIHFPVARTNDYFEVDINGEKVDLYKTVHNTSGIPLAFIEKTLMPRYIHLMETCNNRYGMPMYMSADFASFLNTEKGVEDAKLYNNLKNFCSWVATIRKYGMQKLGISTTNLSSFKMDKKYRSSYIADDLYAFSAIHLLNPETETKTVINHIPNSLLTYLVGESRRGASRAVEKLLEDNGHKPRTYMLQDYDIRIDSSDAFSQKKFGNRGIYLPASFFEPLTVDTFVEAYLSEKDLDIFRTKQKADAVKSKPVYEDPSKITL
jgi:hypothetical protein